MNRLMKGVLFGAMVVLGMAGCGGGGEDAGPVPSFAGTYATSFTLVSDDCNTGIAATGNPVQTVTQNGREIVVATGTIKLNGSVDADNAGFSTSLRTSETVEGVLVDLVTAVVYRKTATTGRFDAGFSVTGSAQGQSCSVSYSGTATLK